MPGILPVMAIVTALLWHGGRLPTVSAVLNTTFDVEVDIWSSMLGYSVPGWKYNETSGGLDLDPGSNSAMSTWSWAGVAYWVTGDVKRGGGNTGISTTAPNPPLIEYELANFDLTTNQTEETTKDSHDLGGMYNLGQRSYLTVMTVTPFASSAELRSVSLQILVGSQASRLEDVQSQYAPLRSPGMENNKTNPGYVIRKFQQQDMFVPNSTSPGPDPFNRRPDISYTVNNDTIDINPGTEIAYKVPKNTTLVRLFQDVGPEGGCFFAVSPRPQWWPTDNQSLIAQSRKPHNRSNQTLQLLPLDPEVEYEIAVGPFQNDSTCNLGGVTSYSFFARENAFATTPGPGNATTSLKPQATNQTTVVDSSHSKGANVGAIEGGIVGGVGGAALLLLTAWLLLRRHTKRKQVHDVDDKSEDRSITPFTLMPSTVSSSTTDKAARDPASSPASTPEEPRAPPAVSRGPPSYPASAQPWVQYAQDAEDVAAQPEPTILPPRYNEAWGQRLMRNAPRRVNRMLKAERPMSPIRAHDAMKKP